MEPAAGGGQPDSAWRGTSALLACATLLGLGLRAFALGAPHLWMDELSTVLFTRASWADLLRVRVVDVHPPLYYALQKVWNVLGEDPGTMRLLPVLFGTACVPLVFCWARSLIGRRGALVAAFLVASSPMHVLQSRDLRQYALLNAAYLVALVGLRASLRSKDPRLGLALLVAGFATAFYAHNTALVAIACSVLLVVVLWSRSPVESRRMVGLGAAYVALGLLLLPWLPILRNHAVHTLRDFWIPDATVRTTYGMLLGCYPVWWGFKIPLYALVGAGLVVLWRNRLAWWTCVAFGVGVPLLSWTLSLVRPIFVTRSLAWVSTVWMVLAAAALARVGNRWVRGGLVILVVAMHLHAFVHAYRPEPGRTAFSELADVLRSERAPGDGVLLDLPSQENWVRYEVPELFDGPRPGGGGQAPGVAVFAVRRNPAPPFAGTLFQAEELASGQVAARLEPFERVWVVSRPTARSPLGPPAEALLGSWRRDGAWGSGGFALGRFVRR